MSGLQHLSGFLFSISLHSGALGEKKTIGTLDQSKKHSKALCLIDPFGPQFILPRQSVDAKNIYINN